MLFWSIIRQAKQAKDYDFYNCIDYLGEIFGIKDKIIDRIKAKWYKF